MGYTDTLALANLAIEGHLDEPAITDWSTGKMAKRAKTLFKPSFYSLLKRADIWWWWCRQDAELTKDTVLTHVTDWKYAFDLPSDLIQGGIRNVYDRNRRPIIYELIDDHIMSDQDAFTDSDGDVYPRILYTRDPLTAASDPTFDTWVTGGHAVPDEWGLAFAAFFAWRLAITVTKNRARAADMQQLYLFSALPDAEAANAHATPGYGDEDPGWEEEPALLSEDYMKQPRPLP